jgi:uncharacterized linocin/CFP29 family protein
MSNFLNRDDAPLSDRDWEQIDNVVTEVARRQLVGRRFIQIFGPLGAAVQDVDYDTFASTGDAMVAVLGEEGGSAVRAQKRIHENIPILYKDFLLYWRDLETARKMDMPIDVSSAAAAASYVARKEDELIFYGDAECGYEGLMTATDRHAMKPRDWQKAGNAFQDILDARTKLLDAGFFGPYALAVSPVLYAQMHQIHGNSGVLEINHIREICTAGVFQTPVLKKHQGVLVSVGIQNFDIALAQDLITAYLGVEQMNHPFRVMESLVLRLKRPGAICTLEG